MAVVERTIRQDGTGDYTSIAAWHAAANLNSGADIWKGVIDDSNAYDEALVMDAGGTDNTTSFLWLTVSAGNRHAGVWDTSKARIAYTGSDTAAIELASDFAMIEWLQIFRPASGNMAGSDEAIRVQSTDGCLVSRCLWWTDNHLNSSDNDGLYAGNWSVTNLSIDHCVWYGWERGGVHMQQFTNSGTATPQSVNIDHCFGAWCGNSGFETPLYIRQDTTGPSDAAMYNSLMLRQQDNINADVGVIAGSTGDIVNLSGSHNVFANLVDGGGGTFTNTLTDTEDLGGASAGQIVDTDTAGDCIVNNATHDPVSAATDLRLQNLANNQVLTKGTNRIGSEPDPRQDFSIDIAGNARPTTNVDPGPLQVSGGGGPTSHTATTTVTGITSKTVTATRSAVATAALTPTTNTSAVGEASTLVAASATMAGDTAGTTTASVTRAGTATITGDTSTTAAGQVLNTATATMAGTTTTTTVGGANGSLSATAAMAGTTISIATSRTTRAASTALPAESSTSTSGTTTRAATTTTTATTTTAVSAARTAQMTAALAGETVTASTASRTRGGQMTAQATTTVTTAATHISNATATATLAGVTTTTATGAANGQTVATTTMAGTTTATTAGQATRATQATLTGATTTTATGTSTRPASTTLTVTTTTTTDGTANGAINATMTATTVTSALPTTTRATTATLTGHTSTTTVAGAAGVITGSATLTGHTTTTTTGARTHSTNATIAATATQTAAAGTTRTADGSLTANTTTITSGNLTVAATITATGTTTAVIVVNPDGDLVLIGEQPATVLLAVDTGEIAATVTAVN